MRQDGVALIVVLWVVVLLSLLAASFGLGVRREAALAIQQVQGVRLLAACEAAVHYAAYRLSLADPSVRWQADGRIYAWRWEGIEVRLRAIGERGKVDLNRADAPLLKMVLRLAGANETQAEALADAILDWRDGDQWRRLHGAEAGEYAAARLPYTPANRPFHVLEEVGMVMGMTPELIRRLLPWVTLYNGGPGIDPAVAPDELLRALPGVDPHAVEAYLQGRREGNPPPFPQVAGIPLLRSTEPIFSLQVQAREHGRTVSLQTSIQMEGDVLSYLQWREAPLPYSLFDFEESSRRSAASPAAMTR